MDTGIDGREYVNEFQSLLLLAQGADNLYVDRDKVRGLVDMTVGERYSLAADLNPRGAVITKREMLGQNPEDGTMLKRTRIYVERRDAVLVVEHGDRVRFRDGKYEAVSAKGEPTRVFWVDRKSGEIKEFE